MAVCCVKTQKVENGRIQVAYVSPRGPNGSRWHDQAVAPSKTQDLHSTALLIEGYRRTYLLLAMLRGRGKRLIFLLLCYGGYLSRFFGM